MELVGDEERGDFVGVHPEPVVADDQVEVVLSHDPGKVPALIGKDGVKGIKIRSMPKGYLALLRSYTGVYDLTAEAIIHGRKDYVIQAMLANPVVHQATPVAAMVDRMIDQQQKWLGYLK